MVGAVLLAMLGASCGLIALMLVAVAGASAEDGVGPRAVGCMALGALAFGAGSSTALVTAGVLLAGAI